MVVLLVAVFCSTLGSVYVLLDAILPEARIQVKHWTLASPRSTPTQQSPRDTLNTQAKF